MASQAFGDLLCRIVSAIDNLPPLGKAGKDPNKWARETALDVGIDLATLGLDPEIVTPYACGGIAFHLVSPNGNARVVILVENARRVSIWSNPVNLYRVKPELAARVALRLLAANPPIKETDNGLLHDRAHVDPGPARAAKSVRVEMGPSAEWLARWDAEQKAKTPA